MTTLVRITNGIITKNFSTGDGMVLVEYKPNVAQSFGKVIDDDIRVDFIDAVTANNRATVQAINLMLEQARNYKDSRTGPRVYLEIDPGNTGEYWRSQIENGYIELADNTIETVIWSQRLQLTIKVS